MENKASSLNFDKPWFNTLHYKKKKDGKHEFGLDIEAVIPQADEIRMLGNKNRHCRFYQIGVELCHT